jgi:hypothetical protein
MVYNKLVEACKNKTLIYFCVFHNEGYLDLLKLLLVSLITYSDLTHIDLLILTSENLVEKIQQFAIILNIKIDTFICKFDTLKEALCSRLYIFDYPLISLYNKILYLDTDIIIQNDINRILNNTIEDLLYGVKEGTIDHPYWGGSFFDFTKVDTEPGMNSGILLFKPSQKIKDNFLKIIHYIQTNIELPECPDQSLLNYYFYKEINLELLDTYAIFYSKDADLNIIKENNIFCHFTWPIGDPMNKLFRMKIFLTNVLKASKKGYIINPENIINCLYNWNNSGYVTMKENNILNTTWIQGTYEWIDTYSVFLNWNGFSHYTRFNDTYSNYYAIRLGDCELSTGHLDFIRDRIINNQHIVIILTMTVYISNSNIALTTQVDANDRIKDYIKTVRLWLKHTLFKIVLIENSGYRFEELSDELKLHNQRFEIITYNENTLDDVTKSTLLYAYNKGSSELFAINYAYKHSKFIQSCKFIIKITGGYFIQDLESYLIQYNLDSYDVLVQNNIKLYPRCEMVGCHKKNFDHVFSMKFNNTSCNMVEIIYRNRCLTYSNILECKRFTIEPTQRGGINMIYDDI